MVIDLLYVLDYQNIQMIQIKESIVLNIMDLLIISDNKDSELKMNIPLGKQVNIYYKRITMMHSGVY